MRSIGHLIAIQLDIVIFSVQVESADVFAGIHLSG